ncbi:hypothetical protein C8R44DRAFT_859214 [Mycena epipterygia]|nr:hypothetical protein C8R44DRAFT_859214 [Mycena epipterygia]
MLSKLISTAILLLALAQGIASTPSLAPRTECGPGVGVSLPLAIASLSGNIALLWHLLRGAVLRPLLRLSMWDGWGGNVPFSHGLVISRSSDYCTLSLTQLRFMHSPTRDLNINLPINPK